MGLISMKYVALYNEIAQARGSKKVTLLNALATKLQKENIGEALEVATEAYDLALKLLLGQWKKHGWEGDPEDVQQLIPYAGSYPDYVRGVADSCYEVGRCYMLLSTIQAADSFLSRARILYAALGERSSEIGTLHAIARMHTRNGMYQPALDICMQGLALRDETTEPEQVINILATTADVYYSMAKNEEALLYYEQALEVMNSSDSQKDRSRILTGFGIVYCAMSRYHEALEYLQQSLELTRKAGNARSEANNLLHIARVYWELGEYRQALEVDMEALAICEAIHDYMNISNLHLNIANIYLMLGNYETAGEHYNKSLKIAESIERLSVQAAALEGLAILYTEWKDYVGALEYFHRALQIYEQSADVRGAAGVVSNLGIVYQKTGDREKAWEQFQHFLSICQNIHYQEGEIIAYYNLGEMSFLWEDYEQAEQLYAAGLAISEEIQLISKIYRGKYRLGKVYIMQGKTERALEYLTNALAQAQQLQEKEYLLEIYRELSEMYEKAGEYEKTIHYYREYHRLEKEIFNEQAHEKIKKLQMLHKVEQAEKEKEIYRITSEKLQQENDIQKKELASKAMYLSQKNELLNKIRKNLRGIAKDATLDVATPIRGVIAEIETALADEQTWSMFEEQFQKLQQPFMQVLTERYPSLSPLEVRVCALIKLNLSSKEISRILNVAPRSIEVYRYRIRKKLGFDATDNLSAFLLLLDQK